MTSRSGSVGSSTDTSIINHAPSSVTSDQPPQRPTNILAQLQQRGQNGIQLQRAPDFHRASDLLRSPPARAQASTSNITIDLTAESSPPRPIPRRLPPPQHIPSFSRGSILLPGEGSRSNTPGGLGPAPQARAGPSRSGATFGAARPTVQDAIELSSDDDDGGGGAGGDFDPEELLILGGADDEWAMMADRARPCKQFRSSAWRGWNKLGREPP